MFARKKITKIFAPADGDIVELKNSTNPLIKELIAKEGFILKTHKQSFLSPISGKVVMSLKTKKAYKIKNKAGVQVLLFLALEGNYWVFDKFFSKVDNNQKIKAGRPLCDVSLKRPKSNSENTSKTEVNQIIEIPILTTSNNEKTLKVLKFGTVKKGDLIAILK
ncbi:PTS glucose transporter subunit IIA [Mesoplasma seiffertii]|uniref:PTS glucose transporter subunit IIA n=1 Tax=Mesoplasma seiffertii TaxID=28224 RepID=UPI00047CE438|nr:PTS glucose transporter subunit IIA [Mesoplasma seiffertii]